MKITVRFTSADNIQFKAYDNGKFAKVVDGKTVYIDEAEFTTAQTAINTPAEPKADPAPDAPADGTPEPKADTPKAKTHPTADAFLAKMPAGTYIFKRNNKGHIRIFKTEDSKTAYAKLCPKKEGVNICPSKELREAKPDVAWVYHEGWACKYAYKAADWDEVATILGLAEA